MSEKKDIENPIEEKKRNLESMERVKPEIEEWASVNYHRKLLKQWLSLIVCIGVSVVLAFVLVPFLPKLVEPATASEIENAARAIAALSITMNGLFIPSLSYYGSNRSNDCSTYTVLTLTFHK